MNDKKTCIKKSHTHSQQELECLQKLQSSSTSSSVFHFSNLPPGSGPSFYNWENVFPELGMFLEPATFRTIVEEAKSVSCWTPWPETHFLKNGIIDWTVFPFLHTFPALDESKKTYLDSTCSYCPKTVELLKKIPNVRTALFSRLGYGTQLNPHTVRLER